MRVAAKLIQAVTVGALATLGARLAMLVAGSRGSFLPGLALSVGVPSAITAMTFFPVSAASLASRWSLSCRVLLPTAAVCAVNRLLVFRVWERESVAQVIPQLGALDLNAKLLVAAMGVAATFAFLAQPVMKAAAAVSPAVRRSMTSATPRDVMQQCSRSPRTSSVGSSPAGCWACETKTSSARAMDA
jgi:hypothetical protein